MKITKSKLKQIIKEELGKVFKEGVAGKPIYPDIPSKDEVLAKASALIQNIDASQEEYNQLMDGVAEINAKLERIHGPPPAEFLKALEQLSDDEFEAYVASTLKKKK